MDYNTGQGFLALFYLKSYNFLMKKLLPVLFILLLASCGGPDNEPEASDGVESTEHRIFITKATTDGAMTGGSGSDGLAKADDICISSARAAGLARTYKAVIGTFDTRANQRIIITGAIYTIAGTTKTEVADSSATFWSASTTNLSNPINRDEDGTYVTNAEAWTGSSEEGAGTDDDCLDWTDNSAGESGEYGDNDSVNATWIESGTPASCNNSKHLYCISQ